MKEKNEILVQVGSKGTGKTQYCKYNLFFTNPNRALVLDIHNEYNDIEQLLSPEIFTTNKSMKGIFRYVFKGDREKAKKDFLKIITSYTDGVLIIEEPFVLFQTLPIELRGILCTHRTKRLDIIINLTSLKHALHHAITQNADVYHFYSTIEKIENFRSILPPAFDLHEIKIPKEKHEFLRIKL